MITISLCMIVKNEEKVIARCLDSISDIFDEIIIVDTGSIDNTKKIAEKYTDKIFDFEWIEDFSAARNFSFLKATMEYCMWLDADDIILENDKINLKELKKTMSSSIDFVMMKYNTAFDKHENPIFSYYRERLIRNFSDYKWSGEIHEVIPVTGKVIYSEIAITHKKIEASDPDRNLRIFEKMLSDGKKLDERQKFYYARELYYHNKYEKAIFIFEEVLSSDIAWIENQIDTCKHMSYCYYGLKNDKLALISLLRSLEFDEPRAEICCDIGKHFFDRGQYKKAIFWYELATNIKRNDTLGGFILLDCYGYIPYIQLCICYYRTGNIKKAKECNEIAGEYKPYSESYLANKEYFNKIENSKI